MTSHQFKAILTFGCMSLALAGCGTQGGDTAVGAGVGAVGGSILTGGSPAGVIGGAVVGGVVGNQAGKGDSR